MLFLLIYRFVIQLNMLDHDLNKFLPNEYSLCFSGQNSKREWFMLIDYEELTNAQSY